MWLMMSKVVDTIRTHKTNIMTYTYIYIECEIDHLRLGVGGEQIFNIRLPQLNSNMYINLIIKHFNYYYYRNVCN